MAQNPFKALEGTMKGPLGIPEIDAEKVRRARDAAQAVRNSRKAGEIPEAGTSTSQSETEMPMADAAFKRVLGRS